jgi:hypothetical protein
LVMPMMLMMMLPCHHQPHCGSAFTQQSMVVCYVSGGAAAGPRHHQVDIGQLDATLHVRCVI